MHITDTAAHFSAGRTVRAGIWGAIVGGTTVELFLFAAHAASWPGTYQWVASGVVGASAYSATQYAWLGLGLHAIVSLFWAVLYAALAQRSAALRKSPVPAGLVYGIFVFVAMQAATIAAHIWTPPTTAQLGLYVIDHAAFFGLPVALVVTRVLKA